MKIFLLEFFSKKFVGTKFLDQNSLQKDKKRKF